MISVRWKEVKLGLNLSSQVEITVSITNFNDTLPLRQRKIFMVYAFKSTLVCSRSFMLL